MVWLHYISYLTKLIMYTALQWRHNGHDSVSNHQPHDCLLNRLFRRRSKKTSKIRVTGLCAGNSPGAGEFPAQMAGNAENVSIWWRHHAASLVALYSITADIKVPLLWTCNNTHMSFSPPSLFESIWMKHCWTCKNTSLFWPNKVCLFTRFHTEI